MHGEKESLSGQRLFKDHSWRIAEKSWVSGSENLLKKIQFYITTSCLGGFQEKNQEKKMLSPKNKLQHIQLSDTTETSNGTGFYGQMKQCRFISTAFFDHIYQGYQQFWPRVYNNSCRCQNETLIRSIINWTFFTGFASLCFTIVQ